MRKTGPLLIIFTIMLFTPFASLSADIESTGSIVNVILEISESGDYIQVGDYSISEIKQVYLGEDSQGEPTAGTTGDLYMGAMVEVELSSQDESGLWTASSVTLVSDENQEEALADLSNEEQATINATQNSTGEDSQLEAPVEQTTTQEGGSELKLIDGVWTN